jgi:hypothetical protein
MARAALVTVLACTVGCSFVAMGRPTFDPRPSVMPRCNASIRPVLLDGVSAAAVVTLTGLDLADADEGALGLSTPKEAGNTVLAVTLPLAWVIAHAMSGVDGVRARRGCRQARAAHQRWIRDQGQVAP